MKKNSGKIFEDDFRKSIHDEHFVHRLRDSAQSFNSSGNTDFAWNNECDFFVFDTKRLLFYAMEMKSTKSKFMSFQTSKKDSKKMVKYHQIKSLTEFNKFKNVIPCFILNFRSEIDGKNIERTYFIHINDFNKMIDSIGKKSFSEIDLIKYNAKKINGHLKRTHYQWDIETLFENNATELSSLI